MFASQNAPLWRNEVRFPCFQRWPCSHEVESGFETESETPFQIWQCRWRRIGRRLTQLLFQAEQSCSSVLRDHHRGCFLWVQEKHSLLFWAISDGFLDQLCWNFALKTNAQRSQVSLVKLEKTGAGTSAAKFVIARTLCDGQARGSSLKALTDKSSERKRLGAGSQGPLFWHHWHPNFCRRKEAESMAKAPQVHRKCEKWLVLAVAAVRVRASRWELQTQPPLHRTTDDAKCTILHWSWGRNKLQMSSEIAHYTNAASNAFKQGPRLLRTSFVCGVRLLHASLTSEISPVHATFACCCLSSSLFVPQYIFLAHCLGEQS